MEGSGSPPSDDGEARFRALVEHSTEAIGLFDAAGIILYANKSVERLLGYPVNELIGMSGWSFIHPDDHAAAAEVLDRMIRNPTEAVDFPRYRIKHRSGEWRWVETVTTNLLSLSGVGAFMASYRDVTERVRLEEQLHQAQKMEAIGLLAGGIAHDFNNLLTVILGFADHAQDCLSPHHAAASDLACVREAAESAAELTRKLLTFARRQIRVTRLFDLRATIAGFAALVERIVGEDVELEVETAPEPLLIDGDPSQLQQVLLNLATNSRQAMPAGGRLRIHARRLPGSAPGQPGRCELVIADSGYGMSAEVRQRVFEPFFSARAGGTGLGMAVVFGIVQDHRGTIDVESVPGAGTTVRIELPLRAGTTASLPLPATGSSGGSEVILLAEDEPQVRELLAAGLRRLGYTVFTAGDGEEALRIFAREAGRIDMVVLDVIMPALGGRQAFARMQEVRPDLKTIFISGYAPELPGIADLVVKGLATIMQKPLIASQLAVEVRALLDRAESSAVTPAPAPH